MQKSKNIIIVQIAT